MGIVSLRKINSHEFCIVLLIQRLERTLSFTRELVGTGAVLYDRSSLLITVFYIIITSGIKMYYLFS